MRLGLNDIDPEIAGQTAHRLGAPVAQFLREPIKWQSAGALPGRVWDILEQGWQGRRKRNPSSDERTSYEIRKKRDEQIALRIIGTGVAVPTTASMIGSTLLFQLHTSGPTATIAGTLAALPVLAAGAFWSARATPGERLKRHIRLEEMRAAFPLLTLTRAERTYCDTLEMLARTDFPAESEISVRDTLVQLNNLVLSSRLLERQRVALLPLLGSNVIGEIEVEYGELGRRFDAARDPVTRRALEQSLAMCQTRLENAKSLKQGLERIKAQQEAIVHTLSSAQSAIARMHLVPGVQTEARAAEIAETVSQMNQQTYAVEQAVQEVLTLGRQ